MDLLDVMMQIASLTLLTVVVLIIFGGKTHKKTGHYSIPGWNFLLKKLCALHAVRRWRSRRSRPDVSAGAELPRAGSAAGPAEGAWDSLAFRATAPDGTLLYLALRQGRGAAELAVQLALPGGNVYSIPADEECSQVQVTDEREWSAGGLKFVMLEPFVRWRILYSGLLASSGADTLTHVRLNLIWTVASPPVRFPEDWSDELAAEALASESWRDGRWRYVLESSDAGAGWEQWGSVQGVLRADDAPEVVLRARGVRERWWAPEVDPQVARPVAAPVAGQAVLRPLRLHRAVSLLATAYDGTAVYLRAHSHTEPGAPTQAISGSIRYPNTLVESITSTDLRLPEFCESSTEIPSRFSFKVGASRQVHVVVETRPEAASTRRRGGLLGLHTVTVPLQMSIDGSPGRGLLELGYAVTPDSATGDHGTPMFYLDDGSEPPAPATPRLRWRTPEDVPAAARELLCVDFAHPAAACPALVGGKGASLALLSSLRDEELQYSVPLGFCVTAYALERHVAQHPALRDAVRDIVSVNADYDEATLKEHCARAVKLFTDTPLAADVRREVVTHLDELRRAVLRPDTPEVTFAVRSSAIGEDSEEMSAAGQNETVLGCGDEEQVASGLQRCWASLYTFQSTQYRRLHGQGADCGMGVVVQAVVPARVAGVLFSRHPNTGHPSTVLLTANYGLGESVVSGRVEPDTILMERLPGGDVRVVSTEVGGKSHRVVLKAEGSTEEVTLSEAERGAACVTAEECLRLGRLAVRQEELWGAPRDLEWAIYKDKVYLVQARPITSLERWTEYELLHELDTAVMSEEDAFTFANTGEVLPGALSPLSVTTVGKALLSSTYLMTNGKPVEPYSSCLPFFITHYHYGINIYNTMMRRVGKKIDVGMRVLEMAVHGHEVADERMHGIAIHRNPPSYLNTIFTIKMLIRTLFGTKQAVDCTTRIVRELNIDQVDLEDPKELFREIEAATEKLHQCFLQHNLTSSGSVFSQVVAMSILLEGAEQFSLEHLSDIGVMLSSCSDVVSAEVPAALAAVAHALLQSGRQQEFCALPSSDCLSWLRDQLPEVHAMITKFLKDHAHRNIKEFDLATKTWGIDPTSLLQSIQSAVRAQKERPDKREDKVVKTNREIVASVVSPKKTITRWLLRLVLPLCQRTVSHREETKAQSIMAVHKVRLAFLRLASLMQRAWLLPERDLIFYFTLDELRAYLAGRDPALINKVSQRRRYFSAWDVLKFEEVGEGHLQPLPVRDPRAAVTGSAGNARLRGTPVCSGEVIGRACVVTDLAEIGQLQRGDILITHSTDIGWSPYFPLLGGVVTELGGLISHGAVIAREYGLPCVVGASGATSFCRTGDIVLLAGGAGVLERLDTATPTPQPSDAPPTFPQPLTQSVA